MVFFFVRNVRTDDERSVCLQCVSVVRFWGRRRGEEWGPRELDEKIEQKGKRGSGRVGIRKGEGW